MSAEEGEPPPRRAAGGGEEEEDPPRDGSGERHEEEEEEEEDQEEDQEEEREDEEEEEEREEEEREDEEEEDQEEDQGAAGGLRTLDKSLAALHSSSSSESCIPTPSCRICFQGAEQGDLLNPCRCDGSVRYTHQHCLLKWISERGGWSCELCCYRFNILAINMKRPWQWQSISITLVEKVQMVAVFLGSLFLMASITWLLWSALSPQALWQRRDVLFQICYGMYGFMDLEELNSLRFLTPGRLSPPPPGLIVHEGAAVHAVFLRWRAVNLHWDVQSYDKAADMEESGAGPAASLVPRTLWLPLGTLGGPGRSLRTPRLGPPDPWSCACCPYLCTCVVGAGGALGRDRGSGEVVIRVTSV
ncbi:E3 ubiquitin-protein ligase MARCH11 [Merluccius polli]|uniref:RING-type E3 ubiquitin transferase n=1 Tax=Merluccius polli TaxID=89951 RepID=A0AA47M9H0_MERPO|nr:E3 ubiquitin-protein ligase MARCH11 [Merluccius polli]